MSNEWDYAEHHICRPVPVALRDRPVLAFDLDGTLIAAAGPRVARTATDWAPAFWADKMAARLRAALAAAAPPVLVVFTNQSGPGAATAPDRIEGVVRRLLPAEWAAGLRVYGGVALGRGGPLRKPEVGLWPLVVGRDPRPNDRFVGDAAGRPGDFAASDRLFAANLNITFLTERAFFEDDPAPLPPLPPRPAETYLADTPRALPRSALAAPLVLLHGPPAAGKSTLCARLLPNHAVASNDIHKTTKKAVAFAAAALEGGQQVVVDNTHADRKSRAPYVELARERGVPIVAVALVPPKAAATHFNAYRGRTGDRRVPAVAIGRFYSDKVYQPPTVEEGFAEVVAVDWRLPRVDLTAAQLALFDLYS